MVIEEPPGGPRGREARPRGGAPHPREKGVGPLVFIFGEDFSLFIIRYSMEFQDLELCRIGLEYLLLFQPRIPAAGILPPYVNLVK